MIRHAAVFSKWAPIQHIFIKKKTHGTNHFRVQCVLYQLENSKLWRELAAILNLL